MDEPRAIPPLLEEFRDVHFDDGKWCAVHRSGVRIEAEDWPAMVRRACAVWIRVGIDEAEG